MKQHNYFVYIITNHSRKTLYIGVTNNLPERIIEHYFNRGKEKTYAGRYYCYNLVYFEHFKYIDKAIERETELKTWSRKKKEDLINGENPKWRFLNEEIIDIWPPKEFDLRY